MYVQFLSFIACLIVFYLLLVLYLKCKMPFWSKQPVFHWYNLFYWLGGPPGLINPAMPLINKYVDLFNIKTFSLTEMPTEAICEFIKANYIYTGTDASTSTLYTPTQENILAYLLHSNQPSYFTVYQEPTLLVTQEKANIVAVISARPLYVRLNNKSLFNKKKTMFTTYYVDNLCVHPAYRKKGIAATMIQTHYYNLRQQNKRLNTCLFKREGDLNAIVPLVAFKTYCLPLANVVNNQLAPLHTLIEIGISQLHLFTGFIKSQMEKFTCVILPDVTNLTHLLKTGNIRIYCLVGANAQNGILACYIFRFLALTYDGQKACECIATVNTLDEPTLFQYGFHQAAIVLQEKDKIALLLLEETAHSHQLMTPSLHSLVTFTSPTAFFFYNYACLTQKDKDCLIVY